MDIRAIESIEEKINICRNITHQLPEWFDAVGKEQYPDGVSSTLVWAGFIDNKPVGFISIKKNNEFTSEVYVLGVLKQFQRNGIGEKLLEAAYDQIIQDGVKLLVVKTLDSSANYEPYEKTRNFYKKNGFLPVDVYNKIWNEENPCLLMAKVIS